MFVVIALRQLLLEQFDSKMNGRGHYILNATSNAFSNTGMVGCVGMHPFMVLAPLKVTLERVPAVPRNLALIAPEGSARSVFTRGRLGPLGPWLVNVNPIS